MKTFRILLIACAMQMASAMGAWANSFKDMYFIMELAQTERIQIPESMPMVNLTESGRDGVMILHNFGINTAKQAREVMLQYRVYEDGAAPGDSWQESPTGDVNGMGTRWSNNPSIDLIKELTVDRTYILEFRMKGIDTDGTEFYYNNGGQNYKIKFIKDEAPKVKFSGGPYTAAVTFNIDGTDKDFLVPNDVWDGASLGKSANISISKFRATINKYSSNASVAQLRISYGICKKGGEVDYWYSTPATMHSVDYESGQYSMETHKGETPINIMEKLNELYPEGLTDGEEYELCIGFDFDDNEGNNRMFDNNGDGYKFAFVYSATELGPDDRAEFTYTFINFSKNEEQTSFGLMLTENHNIDLSGENNLWGFTLNGFSTYPSYPAGEVKLNYRVYEGTTPQGEWQSLSARSNGAEVTEWSYRDEPVDLMDATELGKTYTLEYYLSGITTTGKAFFQNNGGKNFTVKFKPAPATEHFNFVRLNATLGLGTDTEQNTINLPPSNMPLDDMSNEGREADNVFTLNSWTAETSSQFTSVDMYYSVYPSGGTAGEWKQIAGTSADKLTWTSTAATDFTAGLEKGKNYTLEFYIKGMKDGEEVMFNNDGDNYKVQFLYDDKNFGTGFIRTGKMLISVNGEWKGLALPDCTNYYEDGAVQLGDVTSIGLIGYTFTAHRENTNAEITSVSLQYKAYEPGQSGQWNGIEATSQEYDPTELLDMRASFYAETPYQFTGLEPGKTYILELLPQMTTSDGKYYFFSATEEEENVGFKFKFNYGGVTGISGVSTTDGAIGSKTYNLAGQRVGDDYKGIVIKEGKKILRK